MRQLLFVIALFTSLVAVGQEKIMVSDNPQFNAIVKGFFGYPSSPTGTYLSVQIEKANLVNGVYRNVVRLWYGKGNADYINLVYNTFPTEKDAINGQKEEMRNGERYVYIDWNAMEGTSKVIDLTGATFKEDAKNGQAKSRSIKRASGSYSDKVKEEKSFALTFEGLSLDSKRGLGGTDSESGFNADYYSQEKRIVTLLGTDGKSWVALEKAPKKKGNALHFKAIAANDRDVGGDKIRITGSVSGLNAVEIINSVDIFVPCSMKALTKIESAITWLTVQEYWCASAGIPVEGEPQFRMTLGMLKKQGKGNKLR